MKKIDFSMLGLAVAGIVAFSSAGISPGYASSDLTEAENSAAAFVKAMNEGKADEAAQYILDTRNKNTAKNTSKKKLQKQINHNSESKYLTKVDPIELISVEKQSENTIKASFRIFDDKGAVEISLPIEKVNGDWKLIVDGSVTVE
ncbi:DUF4878 domain-containing protein [Brevibacillus massiliensis]|nr:DUF4878 domain-containing protein [Brevibacillus massiliensis]